MGLIVPHMERIETHHKTPSRFVITELGRRQAGDEAAFPSVEVAMPVGLYLVFGCFASILSDDLLHRFCNVMPVMLK